MIPIYRMLVRLRGNDKSSYAILTLERCPQTDVAAGVPELLRCLGTRYLKPTFRTKVFFDNFLSIQSILPCFLIVSRT